MALRARPRPPRRLRRTAVVLALLLMAAVAAAYRLELTGHPRAASPVPVGDPAAVTAPPGLQLPSYAEARPVAAPLGPTPDAGPGSRLDPGAVRRALGELPDARRLGPRVAVDVATLGGRLVHRQGPAVVTPASTMKLLTATAALAGLGPEHRMHTRVVRSGSRLTLVGGGDPLLARRPPKAGSYPEQADLVTLARRTAERLSDLRLPRIRLSYDASLFTGPPASPAWEDDYLSDDVVSPISALWVDEGRERPGLARRSPDPARAAARAFAAALRSHGVAVVGTPQPRRAAPGAAVVAEVRSAQLVEVVQHVLEASDNEGAELLARQVALAEGRPASFTGASRAVSAVLRAMDVDLQDAVIRDGSGLSREDRLRPRTLLQVLALAADPGHPELSGLLEGLPVAGFSGSLTNRFGTGAGSGLGYVRAKTGTLTGVHGLAGTATGPDGSVLLFVAVADRVPVPATLFARDRLDQIAAALASCACADRGEAGERPVASDAPRRLGP